MSEFLYDEVYLTEKDSQVEGLCPVLNCTYERKWYPAYSKDKKIAIVPLRGHLLKLLQFPHEYDESFKAWNESTTLCFPKEFKKKPEKQTFEMLNRAVEHLKKAKKIIIATDFDNEGASLAMEVIEYAGASDKVSFMLEMGSMDENALRNALANPRKIPFREMAKAGYGRAYLDWAEGMSLSRALTIHLGRLKTVLVFGGVKSPVINMVVERDLQFESHSSIKFWHLTGTARAKNKEFEFSVYQKVYNDEKKKEENEKNFDKQELAEKVKERLLAEKIFDLASFTKKDRKEGPDSLYDLTSLQADVAKSFNLSPEQTMEIAQKLYDQYKIQTYPRTAIKFLKEEEYDAVKGILGNLKPVMHTSIIENILKGHIPKRSTVFNSAKVTSHGGLEPTTKEMSAYSKLSKLEKEVFDMVATRYVANFMQDYTFQEIAGEVHLFDNFYMSFKENQPLTAGYKEIYDSEIFDKIAKYERKIPELTKGDKVEIVSIVTNEGETKPKPRFTYETLLKAMENIANLYPGDAFIKEQLGENGIGTPTTRSEILKQLMNPEKEGEQPWLEVKGKQIVSTQRARDMIKVVPKDIVSPIKRAKMNEKLREIEKGNLTLEDFLDFYKQDLTDTISLVKDFGKDPNNWVNVQIDVESLGTCPVCGGDIVEKPKAYICSKASWKKDEAGSWKNDGCQYSIWKNALEKFGKSSLSKLDVKTLLKNGKVKVKLKSPRNQSSYEKDIIIDPKWGVKVDFGEKGQ